MVRAYTQILFLKHSSHIVIFEMIINISAAAHRRIVGNGLFCREAQQGLYAVAFLFLIISRYIIYIYNKTLYVLITRDINFKELVT